MSATFILHFSISIGQSSLSTSPLNFVPFGLRVKTDARQIPLGGLCVFASNPRALSSDTYLVPNPRSSLPNFRDRPCHSVAPNSAPQFRVFRVFRGHPTRANHPPNSVIFRVIPWPQTSPPFVYFVYFVVIRRAPGPPWRTLHLCERPPRAILGHLPRNQPPIIPSQFRDLPCHSVAPIISPFRVFRVFRG
jgi:hypothetical protein